jgi:voltage-gated potassium channel Kch
MLDRKGLKRYARYAVFSTDDPSGKYAILSFWIIIIMVVFPYFVNGDFGLFLFSLLVSFVLITGVFSITGRSKYAIVALVLIIPALILAWTSFIIDSKDVLIVSKLLSLIVLALVTFSIFLEVVKSKSPIPKHVIWGAIAVYLLIGLCFALLFNLINIITPGSLIYGLDPGASLGFPDFVYFSYVTLTTLGYGDIVPTTAQARSFAILEAITGALYLAILIAKIVSLSISSPEFFKNK